MRIFYLAFKWRFINPTNELIQEALANQSNVMRYGPGFSHLDNSFREAFHKHGPFDLVVLDGGMVNYPGREVWYSAVMAEASHLSVDQKTNWLQGLYDIKVPIVILALLSDAHGGCEAYWDEIKKLKAFVLNPSYSQQFKLSYEPSWLQREKWIDPGAPFLRADFDVKHALMFPHTISEDEFCKPHVSHRYDVSVLGVQYYFRRRVYEMLQGDCRLRMKSNDTLQTILRALVGRAGVGGDLYRKRFIDSINNSLCSVTCAGTIGYPIRKFFEIPAYGSLLCAEFFRSPEALGFQDGENCLFLNMEGLKDFPERILSLRRNSKEALGLIRRGQEMIRECHTVTCRIRQFFEIAGAVVNGSLNTTQWKNGKQQLLLKG